MRILEDYKRLASIQTRRSLVPPPPDRSDPKWEESWRFLFEQYTPAMRRYVSGILSQALGAPAKPEEAADVVQDFLARCLEKGWLSREAENIRCFRAYLQTQLRRHTYDHVEHEHRLKRRPSGGFANDEVLDSLPADSPDPAAVELDRGWVEIAVAQCMTALRDRNETYHRILADLLATDGEGDPGLAEQMNRTPREIAYLKHRARKRFAALFADELRATVRDDEAFEELLTTLRPYLP